MNGSIFSAGGRASSYLIVVHGGAGDVPEGRRALHVEGCRRAAHAAAEALRKGKSALDAVEIAVRALEDDPLFNAGTGACLNEEGHIEHDASVMEGRTLRAGGVCTLSRFAAPIAIARAVLEDGRHVLYASEGAAAFAREKGFVQVDESALITPAARAAFESVRRGNLTAGWAGSTVGAVARDTTGLCAAATSTGGMVNKRKGRVGDSPIIGAGTYADDEAGAASTTGNGEAMIRLSSAKMTTEWMRSGLSAEQATARALEALHVRLGATGGIIAIDRQGGYGVARSTATMSWAARWDGDDTGAAGY